ncbi:hypothetical protein [Cryptosporangium minutisporangium]|uniref:PH domain-containing protein n=1 Tax=Cryptosporangium minutisporangium TaxID=113569 RepID=A0ABP6SQV0_9ACTN
MTIDPVTRRSRPVALLFGALAAASVAALQLVSIEHLRELPGWLIAAPIGFCVLLVIAYVAVFWSAHRRPPTYFQVSRRRGKPTFAAPNTPLLRGLVIVLAAPSIAAVATSRLYAELFANATLILVRTVVVLFTVGCVAAHIWTLYRLAPLRLTSDAVVLTLRRTIPWDALAPDGPSTTSIQGDTLWLLVRHATPGGRPYTGPALAGHSMPPYEWYPLDLRGIYIDQVFLAAALRHYREHPDARPTIGTPAGHQHLLTALSSRPAAAGSASLAAHSAS